jgi:5-hydroxyisourate hydrolase-like protein (transthyretin family)
MKRTQLIALLLVVIMAVAMAPTIAATHVQGAPSPLVGAYSYPTLSAYSSPASPYRGQYCVVYGWLTSNSYAPLPYKNVEVYCRWYTWDSWHYVKSVQTDANGQYWFGASSSVATVYWLVIFTGDSVYYPVPAYKTVSYSAPPTTLTMTGVQIHCTYDPYGWGTCSKGVTGTLTEKTTGQPIAGATVYIARLVGSTWSFVSYGVTDSDGSYVVDYSTAAYYRAYFFGNTLYDWSCSSQMWGWK